MDDGNQEWSVHGAIHSIGWETDIETGVKTFLVRVAITDRAAIVGVPSEAVWDHWSASVRIAHPRLTAPQDTE